MMKDTIEKLDEKFLEFPVMRALEGATVSQVVEAESTLGVAFPDDYREFLVRYGAAMVGPYPIFGLRPVEVMDVDLWSVVEVTRHYHSMDTPIEWTVFSEDHAGNPVAFDHLGVIWTRDHDFGGTRRIADNFEAFLRTQCLRTGETD